MNQIIAVDRVFGFVCDKVGVVVSGELLRVGQRNFCIICSKKSFFFIGFMKFLLYLHRESVSNDNLAHRCKL